MEPITREQYDEYVKQVFRPRKPEPPPNHGGIIWEKMYEHGIGHHWAHGDLILFSPSELKRAYAVGAILPLPKK
jgi:hypothetical protein